MRVAWIAHHDVRRGVGGAERTDQDQLWVRPPGVKVDVMPHPPRSWAGYDRVVISRTEKLTQRDCARIADTRPVFLSHGDVLPHNSSTTKVIRASEPFLTLSVLSLRSITRWAGEIPHGEVFVPWMETVAIRNLEPKRDVALWAHRNVRHKGLDAAKRWAKQRGVPLQTIHGRPRSEVLTAMATTRWFVLLSTILDGGPRSVKEAQLSGCELVVNDKVGVVPVDDLRVGIEQAPERFWRYVCG